MSMPTWDGFCLPVLLVLRDGEVRSLRDLAAEVSDFIGLTSEERAEELGSGNRKALNRIGWATSYLQRVDAISRPRRGHYVIADRGHELIASHPSGITEADLRPLARLGDEWWINKRVSSRDEPARPIAASTGDQDEIPQSVDPVEQIEIGLKRIHDDVTADLRTRLVGNDPAFFEQAVLDLLIAMGYGGAEGRATLTKQSNDEGIDGFIDQDALGVARVYVQAKRYTDRAVGRPELQAFVGALSGKADGGVFFTTSRFSRDAVDYAEIVPSRLILVDGERMTSLMVRYGVGVQVKQTYQLVEVDEDFFE